MLIYFLQDFYDEIADQIFILREQREKCTVKRTTRSGICLRTFYWENKRLYNLIYGQSTP